MENVLNFGLFLLFAFTPLIVLLVIEMIDNYINK